MQTVTVQEARKDISRLLDAVAAGEEIMILRRGKPAASLVPVASLKLAKVQFPVREKFRQKLPVASVSSVELIRTLRER